MLKDLICGMTVAPETAAASIEHNGVTYYLCCTYCAEKFKADPQTYQTGRNARDHTLHILVW